MTSKLDFLNGLRDPQYRREFANEHVGVGLAFQIHLMREKRVWTQEQLGERMEGKSQAVISQLENPDYGRYSLTTLKKLAEAFDVALLVRFVPFTDLMPWASGLTSQRLTPPKYDEEYRSVMEADLAKFSVVMTPSTDVVSPMDLVGVQFVSVPVTGTTASSDVPTEPERRKKEGAVAVA